MTWAMSSFGVAYVGLLLPTIVLVAHLAPAGGSWTTAGRASSGSARAWRGRSRSSWSCGATTPAPT